MNQAFSPMQAAPLPADPKIAAMEAEMRRLELEAAVQQRQMEEQGLKIDPYILPHFPPSIFLYFIYF